jgi:Protein of unknown function (DUF2948)
MSGLLKIKAESFEDFEVISSLLQDALFRVDGMVYQAKDHRFAFVANRFVWEAEVFAGKKLGPAKNYSRARAGLRFEGVLGARIKNIPLEKKDLMLSLLTMDIETADNGFCVTMIFSGDGAIRLSAEVIEVYLEDLTGSWATKLKPDHPVT